MADIFAILPGLRLADLDAMTLTTLMRWRRQAELRTPKDR
ncbi:GpE family phage tail protein [Sphingomonas sp.]|nr:GpE family phage tail protein [Sphingomonas sp.]